NSAGILWKRIRRLADELNTRTLSVLDIATGGGDVPIALSAAAHRAGYQLRVAGGDFSSRAINYARERARQQQSSVEFFALDALQDAFPAGYDVIVSSLFMHHLQAEEAILLMSKMAQSANKMILI